MILKIVFYLFTIILLPLISFIHGFLFLTVLKIFTSKSEQTKLYSFTEKWEGKYIFLATLISLFIYLGINELWEIFIGQSIPYLLIVVLLIQVRIQYKRVKDKDLEGFVKGYSNSQNSDFWVGMRDILKDIPEMKEFNEGSNLSKKQIEDRYIPTEPFVYLYKGIGYSLIVLLIYLLVYSKFPSSIFY